MKGQNNIVLIDDDPMFNFINAKVIEKTKLYYVVKSFEKVSHALGEFNKIAPTDLNDFGCIVFVDINMPVQNGWDFLENFTKLPLAVVQSCKVFMLTSSTDPFDIERSKTYSVVKGFISKPLTVQQVIDISTEDYSSIKFLFPKLKASSHDSYKQDKN